MSRIDYSKQGIELYWNPQAMKKLVLVFSFFVFGVLCVASGFREPLQDPPH